jgi:hypothetical protein
MPSYKNKSNNIEMETIPKKGFNKIYFSFCLFQLAELHPFKVLQNGKSTVLILLFFLLFLLFFDNFDMKRPMYYISDLKIE